MIAQGGVAEKANIETFDTVPPDFWRYERKYVVTGGQRQNIECILKLHPAMFREIFPSRFVNSIYLDSYDFKSYVEHNNGFENRKKYRVRWYGDLYGKNESPMFEIKEKRGLLSRKIRSSFPIFDFQGIFNQRDFEALVTKSDLTPLKKEQLICFRAVLLNRYLRRYYLSRNSKYMVTLDEDLTFFSLDGSSEGLAKQGVSSRNLIIEIKYAPKFDQSVHRLTSRFPFRQRKHSKYIAGLQLLKGIG